MKKTLFILLCAPLFSIAQSSNPTQARQYMNQIAFFGGESTLVDFNGFGNVLTSDQCQEFGIQKVTIERGRKSDKLKKTEYELTDQGRIERIQKPKETLIYSYVNDSLVSSIVSSGKTDYKTNFEYVNGKLKKKEVFREERLRSRVLMEYGQEDKVSFCLLQSGRKLKTSYTMNYEYVDKKLRRQEFMRNDKVVRVWDFSCDPKGEVVEKKNQSTLCTVREENNDGSYTDHVRKLENGEVFLYTHHFNKDSVNYASSCEKESGEKLWETIIDENVRTYIDYAKNGDIKRKQTIKYNADGKITESTSIFGKRQKKTSKSMYTYNEQGLISETSSFYKGKQSYIRKYSYSS